MPDCNSETSRSGAGYADVEFQHVGIDSVTEGEERFPGPLSTATTMSDDINSVFARDEEVLAAVFVVVKSV